MTTTAQQEHAERRRLDAERKAARKRQSIPPAVLEAKIHGKPCRYPNCWSLPQAHHLVPRDDFRTGDPTVNDERNLAPICHTHHQDHHTLGTSGRIPRSLLQEDELEFIFEHSSESWMDAWYPDREVTP